MTGHGLLLYLFETGRRVSIPCDWSQSAADCPLQYTCNSVVLTAPVKVEYAGKLNTVLNTYRREKSSHLYRLLSQCKIQRESHSFSFFLSFFLYLFFSFSVSFIHSACKQHILLRKPKYRFISKVIIKMNSK